MVVAGRYLVCRFDLNLNLNLNCPFLKKLRFSPSAGARDPWHTDRLSLPAVTLLHQRSPRLEPTPRRLRPKYSCSAREEPARVCTAASSFRAEWLQPVARSTDCRTLKTCYLPRRAPINGLRNIVGAPAYVPHVCVPHHFIKKIGSQPPVALTLTHSSPAIPSSGCSLPLCVSFHC